MDLIPPGKRKHETHGLQIVVDDHYDCFENKYWSKFGWNVSAIDKNANKKVLIHVVFNIFEDSDFIKEKLNEIKLLNHFKHDNIIQLYDLDIYQNNSNLYLITELMDTDMIRLIHSDQSITDDNIQFFMYQTIKALIYIHSAGIAHNSLTPDKILINRNCDLKICGFRRAVNEMERNLNPKCHKKDRNFKSPEMLCNSPIISTKSDIWSAGCIFAYFLGKAPIFGTCHWSVNILREIIDVLGTQSDDDMHFFGIDRLSWFKQFKFKEKIPWSVKFPKRNPLALDLLDKMLVFNPNKRWDAEKCITHPYFEEIYEESSIKRTEYFNLENGQDKLKLIALLESEVDDFRKN